MSLKHRLEDELGVSERRAIILEAVLAGKDLKNIAADHNMSIQNVKWNLSELFKKFEVSDRINLIIKLVKAGYMASDKPVPGQLPTQLCSRCLRSSQ